MSYSYVQKSEWVVDRIKIASLVGLDLGMWFSLPHSVFSSLCLSISRRSPGMTEGVDRDFKR